MALRFKYLAIPVPVANDEATPFTVNADPELIQRAESLWTDYQRTMSKIFGEKEGMVGINPGTQATAFLPPDFQEGRGGQRHRT